MPTIVSAIQKLKCVSPSRALIRINPNLLLPLTVIHSTAFVLYIIHGHFEYIILHLIEANISFSEYMEKKKEK